MHSGPTPTSGKPYKTPPPPVNLEPPNGLTGQRHARERHGGGNCGSGQGESSHHDWGGGESEGHSSSGRSFSPPGLFRKHHGH